MNSRSSQTKLQLQLQLTGWLAFSATLDAPSLGPVGGPQVGRTRVCFRRNVKKAAEMSKQKKVKTNSASTCRIRTFSILRTRRSPLRSVWQYRFSSDEDADPGVSCREPPDFGRERTPNAAKIPFRQDRSRRLTICREGGSRGGFED